MRGAWLIAMSAAVGCSQQQDPTPTVSTAVVPCLIPAGKPVDEEPPLAFNRSGAVWCEHALSEFLEHNPEARIVSIVPLEYAIAKPARLVRAGGTQELLVVHADVGPWPRAGDLAIGSGLCGPVVGRSCKETVEQHFWRVEKTKFWVPLATYVEEKNQTETSQVLFVHSK